MTQASMPPQTPPMPPPPPPPPPPPIPATSNDETPVTSAPVHIEHAVQGRDSDLTEEEDAAWWTARRAVIDARGGLVREPPVADIRQ